jgi:hypothetical protein
MSIGNKLSSCATIPYNSKIVNDIIQPLFEQPEEDNPCDPGPVFGDF